MTERKLRLLVVSFAAYPEMGGVETHVYETTRRLAAMGVEVSLLVTDRKGEFPPQETIEGVNIKRVPAYPRDRDYRFAPQIYRVIRAGRGQWNVIHCQGYQTFVPPLAMLAARLAGIPYVLTFHPGGHSTAARKLMQRVQWQIIAPLARRAAKLVVTAKWEQEFFQPLMHLPDHLFTLIPNGGTLPAPPVDAQPNPIDDHLIVSVGRLEPYKGHQRVIAAMPFVLKSFPVARLRIVGQGSYEPELRQLVETLGLQQQVEIKGIPPTQRDEMAALLARASLFTLMSEYEGNPMAVCEALSLSRPVLTGDHPGLKEFADKGYSRAISVNSTPEQVGAAIIEQLHNPLIPQGFKMPTWDDCAAGLLGVYREVASG